MLPLYGIIFLLCIVIAQVSSGVVTTVAEHSPIPYRSHIVIDAGHGGIDGGAISYTGIPESKINLQIAERINDLMHFLGYETIMLRKSDMSLHTDGKTIAQQKISDLKNRVSIINRTSNAIVISIHQNTFSDPKYSGSQVFYGSNMNKSEELAKCIQSALSLTLNSKNRRTVREAKGIYLMEHIQCEGVLIECGFISNPDEELLLRNVQYQKKLSGVIACATSTYLYKPQKQQGSV
jgi:N-acetylmuramoyl-L-alanine amidase